MSLLFSPCRFPVAVVHHSSVTTYHEVLKSYPFPEKEALREMTPAELHRWIQDNWETRGALHQMDFYRVVLDEAHAIKNYKSRTSLACQALNSRFRWALTGTPIQNRLDELYPYFRFLRIKYTSDYATFKQQFCDHRDLECRSRVTHLLSFVMMRRTLKDKMFDRPIVELPPTHPKLAEVYFSREERYLYEALEEIFRRRVNE